MSKYLVMSLVSLAMLSGCTDSVNAEKVLKKSGYSDITTTGYSWFACGRDDTLATGFKAKGPSGEVVTGTVCSGLLFKSSTVRID